MFGLKFRKKSKFDSDFAHFETLKEPAFSRLQAPLAIFSTALIGTIYLLFVAAGTNGALGSWTNRTDLPKAVYRNAVAAGNGYIYSVGGATDNNMTGTREVYYSAVNSDGSLGGWRATTPYPSASPTIDIGTQSASAVVANGYLIVTGGYGSGTSTFNYRQDVWEAKINTDGSLGTWVKKADLPWGLYGHSAVVLNGYIYIINGSNGTNSAINMLYATFGADGSIGPWQQQGYVTVNGVQVMPYGYSLTGSYQTTGPFGHALAYQGRLYLYSSYGYRDSSSTVHNAGELWTVVPGSSGALTTQWTKLNTLPVPLQSDYFVEMNGFLYVLGGEFQDGLYNAHTYSNKVYFSQVSSDGTIAAWRESASSMPAFRHYGGAAVQNGQVYVVGGASDPVAGTLGTVLGNSVISATNNGTAVPIPGDLVSDWSLSTALPDSISNASTITANGYIYVLGGQNNQLSFVNTVYYAKPNADGTVAGWQTSAPLPVKVQQPTALFFNGYVYVIGGYDGPLTIDSSRLNSAACPTSVGLASTLNCVYVAKQNADGSLGPWSRTTGLPYALAGAGATAHNGRVYVYGGLEQARASSINSGAILSAAQNSDGTLGPWTKDTSVFPSSNGQPWYVSATERNGRAWVYDKSGHKIYSAPVNADGSFGNWVSSSIGLSIVSEEVAFNGGFVYVVAPQEYVSNHWTNTNKVYLAGLNSDGTVGTWYRSQYDLAQNWGSQVVPVVNGYLYSLGGTDNIQTTSISTPDNYSWNPPTSFSGTYFAKLPAGEYGGGGGSGGGSGGGGGIIDGAIDILPTGYSSTDPLPLAEASISTKNKASIRAAAYEDATDGGKPVTRLASVKISADNVGVNSECRKTAGATIATGGSVAANPDFGTYTFISCPVASTAGKRNYAKTYKVTATIPAGYRADVKRHYRWGVKLTSTTITQRVVLHKDQTLKVAFYFVRNVSNPSPDPSAPKPPPAPLPSDIQAEFDSAAASNPSDPTRPGTLEMMNSLRGKGCVPYPAPDSPSCQTPRPLTLDATLTDAARRHTYDMSVRQYFAHTTPPTADDSDGLDLVDQLTEVGFTSVAGATQNLGISFINPLDIIINGKFDQSSPPRLLFTGWLQSPSHYKNMMDPAVTRVGIGVLRLSSFQGVSETGQQINYNCSLDPATGQPAKCITLVTADYAP